MTGQPTPGYTNPRMFTDSLTAVDIDVLARIFCFGNTTDYPDPQVILEAGNITLYQDYNGGANSVKDENFDSDGDFALTTDLILGTLQDKINALDNWLMLLVGGLRADDIYTHSGTYERFVLYAADSASAVLCASEVGSPLLQDTTLKHRHSLCIGLEAMTKAQAGAGTTRRMDADEGRNLDKSDPINVGNLNGGVGTLNASLRKHQRIDRIAWCNSFSAEVNTATTTDVYIYQGKQGEAETLLFGPIEGPTGAGAAVTREFGDPLWGDPGKRLIFRVEDGGSTDLDGAPIITFQGGVAVPRVGGVK